MRQGRINPTVSANTVSPTSATSIAATSGRGWQTTGLPRRPALRDAIEKGRFTGVGISHQRNSRTSALIRDCRPCSRCFSTLSGATVSARCDYATNDGRFRAGFTRTTQTNPAFLSFKVGPASTRRVARWRSCASSTCNLPSGYAHVGRKYLK